MKSISHLTAKLAYIILLFFIVTVMGFIALYLAVGPELPKVASIQKIRLQTPMTIYAKNEQLIAEFGDKRRIPITLQQVPQDFINALLSTEDQRFYQHSGVDYIAIGRALVNLIKTGSKGQGGSTITMQVARNYYLTREKRFARKFSEIFLAWKIESELSKDQILELYLNKIHFGHRAYGLGAAAQVYYGKSLEELSLSKLAILAGIPKGESKYNPISNPEHATDRRLHVLNRMLTEGHITQEAYLEALYEPVATNKHGAKTTADAPYFAEMVRREIIKLYGIDSAYNDGLKIYTSLDVKLQNYATEAMIEGLEEYDLRHGYRGAENQFELNADTPPEQIASWLESAPSIGNLIPGIVIAVDDEQGLAKIQISANKTVNLLLQDMLWARKYVDENYLGPAVKSVSQVLAIGDLIRLKISSRHNDQKVPAQFYQLAQIPDINGGFVSISPNNGAIQALVGGYDFVVNQYNGVTQAQRQIGSNIKPFIYSAAFEKQFTPASIINDAPIVEKDITAENFWRPKNDGDTYRGPTRLRDGLRYSKNTISIRLIREIGAKYTKNYLEDVGFPKQRINAFSSLALGAVSFTPLEVVAAYASLANGGYKIEPWFIQRVEALDGRIIFQHEPIEVCKQCEEILARQALQKEADKLSQHQATHLKNTLTVKSTDNTFSNLPELPIAKDKIALRVIEERNHYLIDSILKDVIHGGTATKTLTQSQSPLLKRRDIAGKTGTTNGPKDAWFSGYNINHVATAWVGFNDHAKNLGDREFGGKAALPIWQKFFEKAVANQPQNNHPTPSGIVTVRIDPKTGLLANSLTERPIFEVFKSENVPTDYSQDTPDQILDGNDEKIDNEIIF